MFDRFQMQARGALKLGGETLREAVYPTIPAGWPNRATRRAVKGNREFRLTAEWRQMLVIHPQLRASIRAL